MRAFLGAVVLALLMAVTSGCVYTWYNFDGSSLDSRLAAEESRGTGATASDAANR
jgi:hypothetical protein